MPAGGNIVRSFVQCMLLLVALVSTFGLATPGQASAEIVLSDAAGREVRLARPATHIVTNESLLLISLALIDPDPASRLAGWAAPRRLDRGVLASLRKRFPAIDRIPEVGGVSPANSSAEAILSAKPDLFVVSIWEAGWKDVTDLLTAAGVPVIFLDGPRNDNLDPAEATAFSMELLGKAIGRQAQAEEFAGFVRKRFKAVSDRLKSTRERPRILIDAHAGAVCCSTPGAGNRMTDYVDLAGGRSIGAEVPGYDGRLSPEYVLSADPDVYVATGGAHLAAQGGLVIGGGIAAENARASLRAVVSSGFRDGLTAVREGRAFAISHQLSISALSFLMFECLAKWLHPDIFADLDPDKTLAEINSRFMAVPLEGTFWIDLKEATAEQ